MTAVSVIVPVHNGAEFLDATERQLAAMLAATSASVEVLVIDDHSTDPSLEIVSAWPARYPAVRVLRAEGRGVARARNQAVANASGEYVWFTDADDRWEPQIVQTMLDAAFASNADLVVSNATKVFPNGETAVIEDAPEREQYGARETLERVLDGRIQGHLWNKLFSRGVLGLNPFPLTRAHSDLGGVMALIPRLRTTTAVPVTLYEYLIRAGSILNNTDYRWRDLHDCLAIADRTRSEMNVEARFGFALFKLRNVVIPVINECIRRADVMARQDRLDAIRESRALVRPADLLILLRHRYVRLVIQFASARAIPWAYSIAYKRGTARTPIAIGSVSPYDDPSRQQLEGPR